MNLRMDDMHQKENTIKLSLQSMDFRLSFIEDISRQNLDVLTQLKQCVSQFDVRSRNISSSSTKSSSRVHLDSEESVGDQVDIQQYEEKQGAAADLGTAGRRKQFAHGSETEKSLTPESNNTMRNVPSPILVHSQKILKEDTLQQFTDYTKPSVKVTTTRRSLDRQGSSKHRRSLPKVVEHSPESAPQTSPLFQEPSTSSTSSSPQMSSIKEESLLGRRRGNLSKLRIGPMDDDDDEEEEDKQSTSEDKYEAKLKNVNTNMNTSNSVYSTAHMGADTQVSTQNQAEFEEVELNKQKNSSSIPEPSHHEDQTIDTPPYLNTHPSQPSLHRQGSYYGGSGSFSSAEMTPAYTVPFTPILSARSMEYTTITDEIDTTCVITLSPPRSPSTNPAGESLWDEEKSESKAVISENAALKQAEEMEHRKMEKVIRNRLRQISMDESDSISDIARLVIGDMETEDAHSDHEEEEDLHGSADNLCHGHARSQSPRPADRLSTSELEAEMKGSPVTFDAVQIRIRRASTLDEDAQSLPKQC